MAIIDVFRDIAPQFSSVSDAQVLRFIGYVTCHVSQSVFGCDYELAIAYLAADMIEIANRDDGQTTGMITSKKEGDLSLGYKVPDDMSYVTTYGQKFLQLRALHVFPVMVANETIPAS